MTIRGLKREVGRLREQLGRITPAPDKTPDVFERIEQYAQVFALIRSGEPIPDDMAEVVERIRGYEQALNEARAEAAGGERA